MRTFGMWLLAGLFMLAGWDAFERLDRREDGTPSTTSAAPQESGSAQALEDGTPPPPRYSY
jgi:hypothetical protein